MQDARSKIQVSSKVLHETSFKNQDSSNKKLFESGQEWVAMDKKYLASNWFWVPSTDMQVSSSNNPVAFKKNHVSSRNMQVARKRKKVASKKRQLSSRNMQDMSLKKQDAS